MDKIDELLTRGVDQILPSKSELEKVLRSGKKLRIYQGFDPSSPKLHIGHMIGLRKLRQWQELGHEVIFLIGDFTARIGDPTGKEETRPLLSKEQVEKNAKDYKDQAGKILRFSGNNPIKIKFNSQWLDKLTMPEIFNLAAQVTYQQVIKRGMFKKRLEKDEDISFNEILYPIMQGYDSVAMDIDVEVGGRDQLFNMMMGRDLMHKIRKKDKFVMTTQLLTDAQGNKIGKTTGNAVISFTNPPDKIFGAIMGFPDDAITKGLEYLTDVPMEEIESLEIQIKEGKNPLEFKKLLALEVTKQLSDEKSAEKAQSEFESVFQKREVPISLPTISFPSKFISNATTADVILKTDLASSKSQTKRLFQAGSVDINGVTARDPNAPFNQYMGTGEAVVKSGKKNHVRITIQDDSI